MGSIDRRYLRGAAFTAVLTVALALAGAAAAQRVGEPLPGFTLVDDQGTVVTPEELVGQPWLLNVWATWCPPCKAELPLLEHLAQDSAETGLRVLLLNAGEMRAIVDAYLTGEGIELRTLVDPVRPPGVAIDRTQDVLQRLRVRGLPTTFVMDADGVVQGTWAGALTSSTLARLLERVGVSWTP